MLFHIFRVNLTELISAPVIYYLSRIFALDKVSRYPLHAYEFMPFKIIINTLNMTYRVIYATFTRQRKRSVALPFILLLHKRANTV